MAVMPEPTCGIMGSMHHPAAVSVSDTLVSVLARLAAERMVVAMASILVQSVASSAAISRPAESCLKAVARNVCRRD